MNEKEGSPALPLSGPVLEVVPHRQISIGRVGPHSNVTLSVEKTGTVRVNEVMCECCRKSASRPAKLEGFSCGR